MSAEDSTPPTGAVFRFDDYNIGFTPGHGSMVCFEAAVVRHSTAVPTSPGEGCDRLGSALCIQKFPMNKAVRSHAGLKARWATEQKEKIALVAKWRKKGLGKDGRAKKSPGTSEGKATVTAKAVAASAQATALCKPTVRGRVSARGKVSARSRRTA